MCCLEKMLDKAPPLRDDLCMTFLTKGGKRCVSPNFKTKKALKDQLKANTNPTAYHKHIEVFAPGNAVSQNGTVTIEGPHYPEPHRWYAVGTMKDGVLISVK